MFRFSQFNNLFRSLAVWLGIIHTLLISSVSASASEKPEILVQLAKESIIYYSGLKFVQEVQT
jgi:hypothetical protein